jgi:hypothetical protein
MKERPLQHLDFLEVRKGHGDGAVDGVQNRFGVNAVLKTQTRQDGGGLRVELQLRACLISIEEDFSQATVIKMTGGRAVFVGLEFERKCD